MDRNGKAEAVVIGVGGFLGLGEHDVAVPFSALRWEMDRPRGSRQRECGCTKHPSNRYDRPLSLLRGGGEHDRSNDGVEQRYAGLSRRAILPNASKDQLKNAPPIPVWQQP